MEINELKQAVLALKTREECKELQKVLKFRFGQLIENQVLNYNVGDTVIFEITHGRTTEGVIEKINRKSINIKTKEHGKWKCHPTFIKSVKK